MNNIKKYMPNIKAEELTQDRWKVAYKQSNYNYCGFKWQLDAWFDKTYGEPHLILLTMRLKTGTHDDYITLLKQMSRSGTALIPLSDDTAKLLLFSVKVQCYYGNLPLSAGELHYISDNQDTGFIQLIGYNRYMESAVIIKLSKKVLRQEHGESLLLPEHFTLNLPNEKFRIKQK